ncbi:MAG: RNA polymerase sigma factor [Clostridia bacterium]|nr:RNA polymerase sigma factor [Clostridia bacterium]
MLSFLLSISEQKYHDRIYYIYENFEQELLNYTSIKLQRVYEEKIHSLREDTEDIVYNTLAIIALNIKDIDFTRPYDEIRAYVYTILNREIYDYYVREEFIAEFGDSNACSDEEWLERINIHEENEFIKDAIRSLPEPYNSTLYLRYVEKLSVEEIAKITKRAPSTVYSRLSNGKRLLEAYLKEKGMKIDK